MNALNELNEFTSLGRSYVFIFFSQEKTFVSLVSFFFTIHVKKIRFSVNKKANGEIKQKFYGLEIDFKFKISQRKKSSLLTPFSLIRLVLF